MADLDVDNVRVIFDLERLGELIGAVVARFAEERGLEPPDYDGEEMRAVALYGWQYCVHMADRAEFAKSVKSDLAALDDLADDLAIAEEVRERDARDTGERISAEELIREHFPEHRSEFGL